MTPPATTWVLGLVRSAVLLENFAFFCKAIFVTKIQYCTIERESGFYEGKHISNFKFKSLIILHYHLIQISCCLFSTCSKGVSSSWTPLVVSQQIWHDRYLPFGESSFFSMLQLTSLSWHFYNSITIVLLYHLLMSARLISSEVMKKIAWNSNQQKMGETFCPSWLCLSGLIYGAAEILVGCCILSNYFVSGWTLIDCRFLVNP